MSNSIWKMPDQKPDIFQAHRVLVIYEAHDEPELMLSTQYEAYTADRYINRWCYLDELIAQAGNAERLQKAVDLAQEHLLSISDGYDIMKADAETIKRLFYAIQDEANETYKEIKQMIKEQ